MASSKVDSTPLSPFGCVLRDRNQRDLPSRESKWRNFLVKDRLNENENQNENSWHPNTALRLIQDNLFNSNYRERVDMSSAKKPKTERVSQEETPNLGAASLVQIWESRLSRNRPSSIASVIRSDSGLSCNEDDQPAPPNGSETGDSALAEDRFDSLADWQSDRSRDSDGGESERVRVVDIIRRLAAVNQDETGRDQSGSPTSSSDQAEQRIIFSQAILSPRIRGRQAFADLLMQMERDRQRELDTLVERRAVSRFPQRGRIQSMLRLRSLQRSVAIQDRHRLRIALSSSSSSQVERPTQAKQASSIPQLRERFSTKAENVVTSQSEDTENPKSPCSEKPSHTENSEKPSVSSMPDDQTQNIEVALVEQQDKTTGKDHSACDVEDLPEEPCPATSLTCQGTSSKDIKLDAQETISEDRNLDPQETSSRCKEFDSREGIDAADATTACSDWDENDAAEELEDNYSQYAEETSYDWINGISRPRSYWEDRRKEWYNEMLNSNSKNGEIRQLLERGTVSGFLASEFRERMDRLMESRLERRRRHDGDSQGREEDSHSTQLMSFTQNCQESQQQQQQQSDEEMVEREDEDQEEDSLMSGQYHEASDYFDQPTSSMQIPLPPLLRSWSFSDRAASTSPRRDFQSQSYYQNDRQQRSSSPHHPSVEIELICELRSQMEQLYREMSDLRKSLKSCVDMQMVLMQQSLNKQVHSDSREAAPKKGKCRVCYESKVDSLLYRCGHICTCLKCAHDLQWSSGKCPICSAPIVDVVRAFFDDP